MDRHFSYDDALLVQCAAAAAAAAADNNAHLLFAAPPTATTTASCHDEVDDPYQFIIRLNEALVTSTSTSTSTSSSTMSMTSCVRLFQQHADHYGRRSSSSGGVDATPQHDYLMAAAHAPSSTSSSEKDMADLTKRFCYFVHNVRFIHQYNDNNSGGGHTLSLNRFADMVLLEELERDGDDDDQDDGQDANEAKNGAASATPPSLSLLYKQNILVPISANTKTNTKGRQLLLDETSTEHIVSASLTSMDITDDTSEDSIVHDGAQQQLLTSLSNPHDIRDVGRWGIGHGSSFKLTPKVKKRTQHTTVSDHVVTIPLDDPPPTSPESYYDPKRVENKENMELEETLRTVRPFFRTPLADDDDADPTIIDGSILSIKRSHHYKKKKANYNDHVDGTTSTSTSTSTKRNNGDEGDEEDEEEVDPFAAHLSWATKENPDGVPIVNPPFDQGPCGSCWAFVAAGSLEASAARRVAYDTFRDLLKVHDASVHDGQKHHHHRTAHNRTSDPINNMNTTFIHESVTLAQRAEHDAFKSLNLSIQELLDCDTSADQGCTGGNPLLSFYFMHKYGLTSWENYPYVGREDVCHYDLVGLPVAAVKSWGIVSPNHENNIELVLRYIGPVSVGYNGASASFLAYRGGIYDKHKCKQGANHALLIVGYGEEKRRGEVVRYWIARNSWGRGWGEKGYVRIKRGDGRRGTPGVCGIARSPSVALGGLFLEEQRSRYRQHQHGFRGIRYRPYKGFEGTSISSSGRRSAMQDLCVRMRANRNGPFCAVAKWADNHMALCLGIVSMVFASLAIWTLTGDCRRRNRRRRLRAQRLQQSEQQQQDQQRKSWPRAPAADDPRSEEEISPLVERNGTQPAYGAAG